ncbi:MAG: hypothetical protein WBI17_06940 [Clostridiaceae bacterium]
MDELGKFVITMVVLLILGFVFAWWDSHKNEQLQLDRQNEISQRNSELLKIKSHYNVPTNSSNNLKDLRVVKHNGRNFSIPKFAYLWMKESELNILIFDMNKLSDIYFNFTKDVDYIKIKYDDISFFFNSGEFYTENQVSGGGGGGVSLTGTLVGGALLGGVGAVVGSRKKVDPITSQLLVHDTRETIIKYDMNGREQFIHFELDKMKILFSLIPQKSFDIVFSDELRKSQQTSDSTDELSEKLRKLKKLKEEGLLTELEYENKRMSIIDNI